tara:strand:+ start:813 stop:1049 length:237 start_codon:yes stop_codon:yes gene_type:complete
MFCSCFFCCKCCKSPVNEDVLEIDMGGGLNQFINIKEEELEDDQDKDMVHRLKENDDTIDALKKKIDLLKDLLNKKEG